MGQIKVRCSSCGREFWMDEYENKPCPHCGKVAMGPKSGSSGFCFITEACVRSASLSDDCVELQTLRRFRDNYLKKTRRGRRMVDEYYEVAPRIVKEIRKRSDSKEILGKILKDIQEIVQQIETGNEETAIRTYQSMVMGLKKKFLSPAKN